VVGAQVRDLRLRQNLRQADLARLANVSLSAVQNLEHGAGSSLKTLVQVARALGRADWLESLAPPRTISPMQLLHERRRAEAAQRSRARARAPRG
jgi:transcriptional regulator with XRE-family HTH domain